MLRMHAGGTPRHDEAPPPPSRPSGGRWASLGLPARARAAGEHLPAPGAGSTVVGSQEGGLVDVVLDVEGLAVQDGRRGDLPVGGVHVQPARGVGQLRVSANGGAGGEVLGWGVRARPGALWGAGPHAGFTEASSPALQGPPMVGGWRPGLTVTEVDGLRALTRTPADACMPAFHRWGNRGTERRVTHKVAQ